MKITTENTLTKLIELTKNNIESKPSIDDTASSTDKVYSSSKVDELILNKIVTIALKIGYAEWQQDVYNNYYVEKDLTDWLAQYSFSSSNFSMMVDIDESSAVSSFWSNIKVSRVGNILRFESPVALEYTLTIFVEVWENKLEGEQPLYAFKKNTGDIINDTTPSEDTVYSSSKVEELLSGVSGSGGSTLYEFSTPLKLNYFIKNYLDENIPYYSDITSLADYITDTNKIAVIIPDTSEANAGQLKYTEVINDGVIRCYFTQELDGYSIKSIEIRNISKEESVIPKIKFRIRDTSATNYSCVAESGMTWSEWCSSEYNTISAVVNGTHIQVSNIEGELKNVSFALPDDEIKNMTYYIF